jgi:hypothetical protein
MSCESSRLLAYIRPPWVSFCAKSDIDHDSYSPRARPAVS